MSPDELREELAIAWDRGYMARGDDTYESRTPNPYRGSP